MEELKKSIWRWYGHVLPDQKIPKQAMHWRPASRRKVSRPKDTCQRTIERERRERGLNLEDAEARALGGSLLLTYGPPEDRRGLSKYFTMSSYQVTDGGIIYIEIISHCDVCRQIVCQRNIRAVGEMSVGEMYVGEKSD